jgi:two-component system OmpR family response regulator
MPPHILIVDPDPAVAALLAFIFAEAGYRTTTLADPRLVSAALAEDPADLALLEADLPHTDGFSLCAALQRAHPDLPVIFLSARASLADKVEGFNRGADDYVTKPFEPMDLLVRIRAILSSL